MNSVIFIIFTIILTAGIICFNINLPAIKGKIGEKSVDSLLSFLPKDKYIVLSDLMFKDGSYSTQIDHIIVSIFGIFIIETKNYKGWIFGNVNKDYWTQNIWGNKYSLYNPLFQNRNHVSFLLRKFPMLRKTNVFPLVVFLRTSKLQLSEERDCVLRLRNLKSYIRSFSQEIMSIEECHSIASILWASNLIDKTERAAHKKNVKNAIQNRENKVNQHICPQCGGKLLLRNGRYGDFYGCSNFPSCRYTR